MQQAIIGLNGIGHISATTYYLGGKRTGKRE